MKTGRTLKSTATESGINLTFQHETEKIRQNGVAANTFDAEFLRKIIFSTSSSKEEWEIINK